VVAIEPRGMRLALDGSEEQMATPNIFRLPGSNDERVELLVKDAVVSYQHDGTQVESECTGTIRLADGWLETDFWVPKRLIPEPGSEAASDPELAAKLKNNELHCKGWIGRAIKWEVSMDNLPKAPIHKGPVSLTISPEQVVLASPALRCEQAPWRTETVESKPGWAGAQFGGERITLARAAPTEISDDCRLNLRIWFERRDGNHADDLDITAPPAEDIALWMEVVERELCPTSITVQAISDTRYKIHVEPATLNEIACIDTTGDFVRSP
jgi:hypothetical protein